MAASVKRSMPIGAVMALAEVEAREWWIACGSTDFSGLDFAQHRQLIEAPRAEMRLRRLMALPKAARTALARVLINTAA